MHTLVPLLAAEVLILKDSKSSKIGIRSHSRNESNHNCGYFLALDPSVLGKGGLGRLGDGLQVVANQTNCCKRAGGAFSAQYRFRRRVVRDVVSTARCLDSDLKKCALRVQGGEPQLADSATVRDRVWRSMRETPRRDIPHQFGVGFCQCMQIQKDDSLRRHSDETHSGQN
jgi:hypothetical protein